MLVSVCWVTSVHVNAVTVVFMTYINIDTCNVSHVHHFSLARKHANIYVITTRQQYECHQFGGYWSKIQPFKKILKFNNYLTQQMSSLKNDYRVE